MGELFSASELISKLLQVGKYTYKTAKFVGKVGYGQYAKAKEKEENSRQRRQARVDPTGVLEQLANSGFGEKQYEYGVRLYNFGEEFNSYKDIQEGLYWIEKAAAGGYRLAENFLDSLEEI